MPKKFRGWRLRAWGANSYGQLGLGFQSEQSLIPVVVDLSSSELDIRNVKKIIGGGGHTLALDAKGRVFSCGSNNKGQAGLCNDAAKLIPIFQRVKSLENEVIKDIECGWESSMALTDNGQVYAWGSNSYGQLGIEENRNISPYEPKKINIQDRIKSFSMGLRHSALVTETGRVFTSGSGNKGQLGQSDENHRRIKGTKEFAEITTLKDVVQVACGQNHSAALTKSGQVYTWGDNKYGQLGIDNVTTKSIDCPTKVAFDKYSDSWCELRAGWTHTSVLNSFTLYTWGRNTYGQLGNGSKDLTWIPKSTCIYPEFRRLSIGSEHNVGISEDYQRVYTWGWNEHGNCGNGSTKDVPKPEEVDSIPLLDGDTFAVGCGAAHTFAVTVDEP